MISTKQAKLVRAIQEAGSLSRAATLLNLSQSALSHQLRRLEEEVGIPLFHRDRGRLRITEAGEAVYAYSLGAAEELSRLSAQVEAIKARTGSPYTHGYSTFESNRLFRQANTIADFIHGESYWPEGSAILEVGCGVGAQTRILARQNPGCSFTCIDRSRASIEAARADPELAALPNVSFHHLDARDLGRLSTRFDHLFVCFVLEHVPDPVALLQQLHRHLHPGGTVTIVEGDHGSAYFHPASDYATRAIAAQVCYQRVNGGNANVGRELYPLLGAAGYTDAQVSPRCIYVDDSRPELKADFILGTFTAMIEGVSRQVVSAGIESAAVMAKGIADLKATNRPGGTFSYTFYRGTGRVDGDAAAD